MPNFPDHLSHRERRKLKRAEKKGDYVVSIPQHLREKSKEKGRMDWQKPLYHAIRNLFLAKDVCEAKNPQIHVKVNERLDLMLRIRRSQLTYEEAMQKYEDIRLEIQNDRTKDSFMNLPDDFDHGWLDQWLKNIRVQSLYEWENWEKENVD